MKFKNFLRGIRFSRVVLNVLVLSALVAGVFFVLTSLTRADTAEEPYSIHIIAGQSEAEGSDSFRHLLPDDTTGFNKQVHPADAETKFWWAGADGNSPTGLIEALEFAFEGKSFSGWTFSGYQGSTVSGDIRMSNLALGNSQKRNNSPQNVNEIFGPEYGVSRTLYEMGRRKIIILKVSYGFQSLAQSGSSMVPFDWNINSTNKSYSVLSQEFIRLTDYLRSRGEKYTVDGFHWYQGGTDTLDQDYVDVHPTNFANLVDDARTRFELHPDAHFVAAKIAYLTCNARSIPPNDSNYRYCGFPYAYEIEPLTAVELLNGNIADDRSIRNAHKNYLNRINQVRASLQNVADARDWVDVVDTTDLKRSGDNIHLNELSQLQMGKRFVSMYRLPYRPPLNGNRADFDSDGKSNSQEDTGTASCELIGTPQAFEQGGPKANNGNLGDDDCDGDGYPNYIDTQDGIQGGGL